MIINLLFLLLVAVSVAAAAGYIGSFMVLKRMSLVGDALSHVALPGLAIALAIQISPMLGAFIALTLAVIGIWYLGEHSLIYPEALVGVFFTASLAIGVLITPEPDLLEALFGNIQNITPLEGILAIVLSLILIFITHKISKKLILGIISQDLAKSTGINLSYINLIYLLLVGLVVALGVKFIGTLLMGALVIIPAVTAKTISRSLSNYYFLSIFFAVSAAVIGIILSGFLHLLSGPIVVLTGITLFLFTYITRHR